MIGCGLVLVGCSSSPAKAAKKDVQVTPGATVPFSLSHNARSAVKTVSCAEQSGAWVVAGTVRNPTSKATPFQIVVDFVTQPGGTVLSTTVVNVPSVHPGATATWTATGARGDGDVACIVRQAQST